MASGRSRIYSGAFVGSGVIFAVNQVGFKPRLVQLYNATGPTAAHSDTMAADSALKQVGGTQTFLTSNGITLTSNGFSLGADADLNAAGETVHFVCWE